MVKMWCRYRRSFLVDIILNWRRNITDDTKTNGIQTPGLISFLAIHIYCRSNSQNNGKKVEDKKPRFLENFTSYSILFAIVYARHAHTPSLSFDIGLHLISEWGVCARAYLHYHIKLAYNYSYRFLRYFPLVLRHGTQTTIGYLYLPKYVGLPHHRTVGNVAPWRRYWMKNLNLNLKSRK